MNILILGNDGRAHALAWKLSMSRRVDELFCCSGNGGTRALCRNINFDTSEELLDFAKTAGADYIVSAAGFACITDKRLPIMPDCVQDSAEIAVNSICDGKAWATLPPVHRESSKDGEKDVWTDTMDNETAEACAESVDSALTDLKNAGKLPVGVVRVLFEQRAGQYRSLGTAFGFGAQDAQVLLPILSGDLVGIVRDCTVGRLDPAAVSCAGACACTVLSAERECRVHGMGKLPRDVAAFHEHTRKGSDGMIAEGDAALDIVMRGSNAERLLQCIHQEAKIIQFD